ncbi:hypothetical protein PoB_007162800 [Plakobranchus ocellatus]|uniref:Uncharacterized protein n=1 Tax=Plakobranchus ocellatus TaxID=259542 RepID=A0AAV4DLH2_9GAST|nr:hypothetical protein PoB_007162800 [Plakobranchus ocellatus]
MSDRSIQRKEDCLDLMHEKLCASSKAYVSAVKAALRSHRREIAAEIFERAIDVLSPDFPDPTSIDGQIKEEEGEDRNELNSMKDRIAQMEKQLQEVQNERSTLESELESVRQEAQTKCLTLELELESVRQEAQTKCLTLESELESIKQEAQINSSMKKNVRRLDTKLESLAIETKDSIKERADFTVKVTADQSTPDIWDVQLLPGGRLLLADYDNKCVKLFDTQGQHLHTLVCRSQPCCLAVLDSSATSHTVALTLFGSGGINLLEVGLNNMKVKVS